MMKGLKCLNFQFFFAAFFLTKDVKETILYLKSKACFTLQKEATLENRIQELRKRKKLSQEELAEKLEVTRQTIISLEKGRYNASLLLAHKIASFFNLRIEEVFLFEEDE